VLARRRWFAAAAVLLAAGEIAVDFATLIPFNAAILYGLPLALAGFSRSRWLLWGLTACMVCATFAVYAVQIPAGVFTLREPLFINRVLAVVAIMLTAVLLHAVLVQELVRATRLPQASVEEGLAALLAAGRVTCDSFSGLRWLLLPAWRRRSAGVSTGRWSALRPEAALGLPKDAAARAEFVALRLLHRTGVLFRRTTARERLPVPWRDVARACRHLEARGEIRGGRFVASFDGEQYALPAAVTQLRRERRRGERPLCAPALTVSAADPLNFQGILTPDERIPATASLAVKVG
jgi:hypothetical protein